jgi:hypothetical protein
MTQHLRRIQPDFRALRWYGNGTRWLSIVTEHIVQWCLEIGVTEPLHHHSVHLRENSIDWRMAFHPHNGPDAYRRIERRPEMELVRRVGAPFGRHDAAKRKSWRRRLAGHSGWQLGNVWCD